MILRKVRNSIMSVTEIVAKSIVNDVNCLQSISHNVSNQITPGFIPIQNFSVSDSNGLASVRSVGRYGNESLIRTNKVLDIAVLDGKFIGIDTEHGILATRDGRFQLDENNILIHRSGDIVLGTNGNIQIPKGDIAITGNGDIYSNGQFVDTIVGLEIDDFNNLIHVGNGLYKSNSISNFSPTEIKIESGALNSSDTSSSNEMVRAMELSRHIQSMQKVAYALDSMADKAINELGNR